MKFRKPTKRFKELCKQYEDELHEKYGIKKYPSYLRDCETDQERIQHLLKCVDHLCNHIRDLEDKIEDLVNTLQETWRT
jgi:uncharacterized protein YeaO (DUF488 family)